MPGKNSAHAVAAGIVGWNQFGFALLNITVYLKILDDRITEAGCQIAVWAWDVPDRVRDIQESNGEIPTHVPHAELTCTRSGVDCI